MNNPDDMAVDVEAEINWLHAEKARRQYSWAQLAALTGIKAGTLSPLMTGSYKGRPEEYAKKIMRYRQMLESQAEQAIHVPVAPKYFETPTGNMLLGLLRYAHSGEISVAGTGPGTGKTIIMNEYKAMVSNVWTSTMKPSTSRLNGMVGEVLRSIGGQGYKAHVAKAASKQVRESVIGRQGLIVIDEANHLDLESIEEIRNWHDETNVGICLLGNEELIQRIETGTRRDALGRLNSRIGQRLVQNLPVDGDVEAFCDAWGLDDAGVRKLLLRVALTPGSGGLRECRQIVKSASMLASSEGRPVSFADMRDALQTRATRNIRFAQ